VLRRRSFRIRFTNRGLRWPKLKWVKKIGCRTWGIIGLVVMLVGGIVLCAMNSSSHYSLPRAINLGTAAPSPTSQVAVASPTSQAMPSSTAGPSDGSPTANNLICQGQDCEGKSFQEYGGCTWPYVKYAHVMVAGADLYDVGANIFEVQQWTSNNCGAKRIVIKVPSPMTYHPDSIATATATTYYSSLDVGSALPGGAMLAGGQVHQDFTQRQPGAELWYSSMSVDPVLWDIKGTRKASLTSNEQSGELFLSF
jgi:hypothetical protein